MCVFVYVCICVSDKHIHIHGNTHDITESCDGIAAGEGLVSSRRCVKCVLRPGLHHSDQESRRDTLGRTQARNLRSYHGFLCNWPGAVSCRVVSFHVVWSHVLGLVLVLSRPTVHICLMCVVHFFPVESHRPAGLQASKICMHRYTGQNACSVI